MDLIDRLETFRLKHKITQQEIAAKLGVAFSTVNRWLNRHVKPNKIQSYQIQKLIGEEANRGKRKK
jgi:transcriptional regulator with XRE-family HTH domain